MRDAHGELVRALSDLDDPLGAYEPDDETTRLFERLKDSENFVRLPKAN